MSNEDNSMSMDAMMGEIAASLGRLTVNDELAHDVSIILGCWMNQTPVLDVERCTIKPGTFGSASELYQEIVKLIGSFDLLDLMPYVDDYLEYYEVINTMF
jgi:hypothetical protein